MKKLTFLAFIFLINVLPCYAQNIDTIFEQVFFNFDQHILSTAEQQKIDALTLKGKLLKVYIEANTDTRGTNAYNIKLGAKRAKTVKNYLLNKNIAEPILQIINYGEARPITLQENENNHAKNRRVDITIVYEEHPIISTIPEVPKIIEPIIERKDTNDIAEIYKELAIKPEVFHIKREDTIIISKRGTILVIDGKDINCSCRNDKNDIRIDLKEVYTKSDIVREQLTTIDNNGQRLESGGMVHLDIFCKNKRTWLSNPIQILIPTEKFIPGMFAYTGTLQTQQFVSNQGTFERSSVIWSKIENKQDLQMGGCGNGRFVEKKSSWLKIWWYKIRREITMTRQERKIRRIRRNWKKREKRKTEAILDKETKVNSAITKTSLQKKVKFYVMDTRKVNWLNVDQPYFSNTNLSKEVIINTPVSKSTNISIFLKGKNSAFPASTNEKKQYSFSSAEDEKSKIVALKISDQKEILLAFQDVDGTKDNYDLDFKVYSLKEIKKKLKELDKY